MTSPERPSPVRPVDYKGEPLDAERGPGLGCFRLQLVALAILIVLTPLSVTWGWPSIVSALFLFMTIIGLLFAGQTVIFLLRLVAADRREGRRRPLESATRTVGELEDELLQEPAGDGGTGAQPAWSRVAPPVAPEASGDVPDDELPERRAPDPGMRE